MASERVVSMKSILDERQLRVLHLRFVERRTEAEIGGEVGLSQSQISRLIDQTFDRIRQEKNIILEFDA